MRLTLGLLAAVPLLMFTGPYHVVGLGNVLHTSDGGQIFGFDINQNGNDGVLASRSVETFDQNSGAITKTFAVRNETKNSYSLDGIFAGDIALVTHYVQPKGTIYPVRHFQEIAPVTGGKFTGKWPEPMANIDITQGAVNQTTATSVLFAIELKNQDNPLLVVTNFQRPGSKVIALDPNLFGTGNIPLLAQDTATNQAVIAESPDAGAVGGAAPINALVNLSTGRMKQFSGYNDGPFHAGYVNGLAVDSKTGVEATTTELNAQVEFYNLATQTGIAAVQLPCSGNADQSLSGSGLANDALHKLFVVTEQYYCNGSEGSAIVVYDESGNFVEAITGFRFYPGEPAPVLNPAKRMGWAFGPQFNELQQFYY